MNQEKSNAGTEANASSHIALTDAEVGYAFGLVLGATITNARLKAALLKWATEELHREANERRRNRAKKSVGVGQ